jgi:hypothetical protein
MVAVLGPFEALPYYIHTYTSLLHSDYGTNVRTRWIATEIIYWSSTGSLEREVPKGEDIPIS